MGEKEVDPNSSQAPASLPQASGSSAEELQRMLTGYWVSQCLYVVAKLGVADHLSAGPKSSDELARALGAHGPSLYRVLRALASLGIFAEDSQGRFTMTALAERLRSDSTGSMRHAAIMYGEETYQTWGHLLHTVQTGQTGFEAVFGKNVFDYYKDTPGAGATFSKAMTQLGRTMYPNPALLAAYDFSSFRVIVDVGGGHGDFLCDILQTHPNPGGVIFDLPQVVEGANSHIRKRGFDKRCRTVSGDFFAGVHPAGDAYILKRILHDWDDARAITILGNIRKAMNPSGKVLVIETVIPPGNDPFYGKLLDLHMMMFTGGQERTPDQYARLFSAAGLRLNRIVPTSSLLSVVEAVRAEQPSRFGQQGGL